MKIMTMFTEWIFGPRHCRDDGNMHKDIFVGTRQLRDLVWGLGFDLSRKGLRMDQTVTTVIGWSHCKMAKHVF